MRKQNLKIWSQETINFKKRYPSMDTKRKRRDLGPHQVLFQNISIPVIHKFISKYF